MESLVIALHEIQNDVPWANIFNGLIVLVAGQILLKAILWSVELFLDEKRDNLKILSYRKAFAYFFNILLFLFFLKIIKVEMKVILGATGLLTIAIGFAARTPISNLISGFFLIFERPFVVGNVIEVNGIMGEVVSRNLLSLTMRTLDNRMMRIPNETVMGTTVSNLSYFPIRRLDLSYLISNRESISRVEKIFKEVASRNGLALDEPLPYFYVKEFRETCIEVIFRVWSSSEDFLTFQSEFPKEIHRAMKTAGLEMIRHTIETNERNER